MVSFLGINMVVGAMLCWTIASIGYKFALGTKDIEDRDPITAITIRVTIITVCFLLLSIFFGDFNALVNLDPDKAPEYWFFALISGITSAMADICYFNALRYMDSSRVYPLINSQILFTYPFSFLFFGEPITAFMWIAAILIIFGVIFVGDPDAKDKIMENLTSEQKKKNYTKGIILSILTGFFFATTFLSIAWQNRILVSTIEGNLARITMYTAFMWVLSLVLFKHFPSKKTIKNKEVFKSYLLVGLFGVISAGIGDWIYQIGVIELGTALSITIVSAAPLLNQLFAILFLKEKFRWRFLIGVFFIVLGNIIAIY